MSITNSKKRIFVAGHGGMVGSAIIRQLTHQKHCQVITRSRKDLDLTCQRSVSQFFENEKLDEVYLAAAKVGGIHANSTFPVQFLYENLMIQSNVINSAFNSGIAKLLFLGSSCIYPKLATQPIKEEALLTGALEITNEPYALAKIAGIKMCESYNRQYGVDFRSVMPCNLYGPGDNFHPENSHVIPAIIRRIHLAKVSRDKEVVIWGSGKPMREFLHVDDMASASISLMGIADEDLKKQISSSCSHLNIGSGVDSSIRELAELVSEVVGYKGDLRFDISRPDGAPKKLLDVSRLHSLGWRHSISLRDGIESTYGWYLENFAKVRDT